MHDHLLCVRNVRKGAFGSEPGRTRFLLVPHREAPVPQHSVSRKEWLGSLLDAACVSRQEENQRHDRGDIVVFVHGYNNSPAIVGKRHRLLRRGLEGLGYRGAVVSFDWPSASVALNYAEDRVDAKRTALRLVSDCISLFVAYSRVDCPVNVHLLAHSTGAFVVREAFDDADDRPGLASVAWAVSQVLFIGADISSRSLSDSNSRSAALFRHAIRVTNYSNPYDSILKLSNVKRIGASPRAGRVGIPVDAPEHCVNVDCGEYYSEAEPGQESLGSASHSWHLGDEVFLQDMLGTIRGDVDRHSLPTRRQLSRNRVELLSPVDLPRGAAVT